jgi:hypothetical protein
MSIEDILNSLPSKEEIAQAVWKQTRQEPSGDFASALGIFGAGALLGAGLALLLAPKSGTELRQEVAERLHTRREQSADGKQEPQSP